MFNKGKYTGILEDINLLKFDLNHQKTLKFKVQAEQISNTKVLKLIGLIHRLELPN